MPVVKLSINPQQQLRERLLQLYKTYRTALLNRKYYASRLTTFRKWNMALEIALAVGTSGTIGAWAVWSRGDGRYAWTIIAGLAAILAILKPILALPKQIERYTKLFAGYSDLYYDLEQMADEVRVSEGLRAETGKSYQRALDRFRKLSTDDDAKPDETLRWKCYRQVLTEIPAAALWLPSIQPAGDVAIEEEAGK